jgi:hypothetical protein
MIGRALRGTRGYFHLVNSVLGILNPHGGPRLVALLAVVTLAACGGGNEVRSPFTDPPPAPGQNSTEDPIRVEIQNLSFNDVTVWAVRSGGQRIRIARVTGKTDRTVTIGWNVAVPVAFFIEQTAGRSCTTGQVGVEPEARVWVQVPSNVGRQPCRAGRR